MIRRLHELQAEAAQNLPQDSQGETTQTSGASAGLQGKTEGGEEELGNSSRSLPKAASKPTSQLGSALKNGGSASSRLLPDFVYQASPDGGKKRAAKENGKKAKQKLHLSTASTASSSSQGAAQEAETSSDQLAGNSSWSEMSSMVIGSDYHLAPLSAAMEQRLILQYLTPLGDYQEVRVHAQKPLGRHVTREVRKSC